MTSAFDSGEAQRPRGPVAAVSPAVGVASFARRLAGAHRAGVTVAVHIDAEGVQPRETVSRVNSVGRDAAALLERTLAACGARAVRLELPACGGARLLRWLGSVRRRHPDNRPRLTLCGTACHEPGLLEGIAELGLEACLPVPAVMPRGLAALLRRFANVRPVLHGHVASGCRALGVEAAHAYLPESCLAVPRGAALVPAFVDLLERERGAPRTCADLSAAVTLAVRLAEEAHEHLRWPLADQTLDAFMNRRVAIVPRGIGDWLRMRTAAAVPSRWHCEFDRLVNTLLAAARRESQRLAQYRGEFPSMQAEHVFAARNGAGEWRRRRRKAVAGARYRHRQLVFVQLADCWPSGSSNPAFAELLPRLGGVDGIGFGGGWQRLAASPGSARILTAAARSRRLARG
ncbi:MAG: hypothetical protein AAFX58_03265 [Pseudomonadota bacterium]